MKGKVAATETSVLSKIGDTSRNLAVQLSVILKG